MHIDESYLSVLADDVRTHIHEIKQRTVDLDYFVVGGAVRDTLLGLDPNDLDFVVVGESPEEMMGRGFKDIQATSFPVFMDSEGAEWALARTENKVGDGYHGFEIETENVSLEQDLGRRDLTINSMAFKPHDWTWGIGGFNRSDVRVPDGPGNDWVLVDPHGGFADLKQHNLCPTSEAFKEDPIRVLRLARYAARFPELDVADIVIDMSREVAYELNRCSRERIGTEIVKAMSQAEEPRRFWEVLRDTGALAVIFPELDRATLVPAGPDAFHQEGDTFEHTMMVLDRMHDLCAEEGRTGDELVRRLLMAIAHDIGKVIVADNEGGLLSDPPTRFGGHARIGAKHVPHIAQAMGLEKQYESVMQDACEFHMDFFNLSKVPKMAGDHEAAYNVKWAASMLSNFDRESKYGASPEEMLDLIQADHEGRLEPVAAVTKVGDTWTFPTPEDGEPEVESPTLDREPYERVIEAVDEAAEKVDGFTVMQEGLCQEHLDVEDHELHQTLVACDDCREPGPWVGERIETLTNEHVRVALGGETQ